MKYILGIDTTFHSSCVSLVDETGKVLANHKNDIDFDNQDAKKFLNFHNRNVLSLAKPILDKYGKDIFLVSASCQDGPFHSMPVGVIAANSIGHFLNKSVVGVNHDMAHIHANWLDRDEKDFSFPIVSLNVSGAHSNIYLVENPGKARKISEIIWRNNPKKFGGLGALFDVVCYYLNIKVKKGGGGLYFERLASSGESKLKKSLKDIMIRKKDGNFHIDNVESGIVRALESYWYSCLEGDALKEFQRNFAASLSEIIFNFLVKIMAQTAKETNAREIHLAGGVALDKSLNSKLATYCKDSNFNFKFPLKPDYCRDNAAMTAISGYFKWRYSDQKKDNKFLTIEPLEWYYKYYAEHFSKLKK